jgi:hypothetical protein
MQYAAKMQDDLAMDRWQAELTNRRMAGGSAGDFGRVIWSRRFA